MCNQILGKIYDNSRSDSWSSSLRKKRFAFFASMIDSLPNTSTIKILDVGGRPAFWEKLGLLKQNFSQLELTFINLESLNHPHFNCLIGDARNMHQFLDQEFDIVFSNSVIEHVGDYQDQHQMANEIKRIGKRYFVQTPNLYFPIEPHFLFPFFQFLPVDVKVWFFTHFNMGWYPKMSVSEASKLATQTQLLSKQKLINLFPEANLYEEKILGLTKSLIVYSGW